MVLTILTTLIITLERYTYKPGLMANNSRHCLEPKSLEPHPSRHKQRHDTVIRESAKMVVPMVLKPLDATELRHANAYNGG